MDDTRAYVKVNVEEQDQERSICGFRQRILKKEDGAPASITRLRTDHAQPHWHRHTDEYYFILRGEGVIIIDGEEVPVRPGDCVWIRPGHVHQSVGDLESLIIGVPPFDYDDVVTDPPSGADR